MSPDGRAVMLEWLGAIPLALWLEQAGYEGVLHLGVALQQNASRWALYDRQNSKLDNTIAPYFQIATKTGIWIQSGEQVLANQHGTTLFSGASLTKIATTLAALQRWSPDRQFITTIGATSPIVDGVVQGDLVVVGGGDPLLVWLEAIAIGQTLNQHGITGATGDLIITGELAINYQSDPLAVGALFYRSINSDRWNSYVEQQYQNLPHQLPRPKVAIAGQIRVRGTSPTMTPLLRHKSLPLTAILKRMNVYSHNRLSQQITDFLGGTEAVRAAAVGLAGIPDGEVQLVNGSGLGVENRLSPRASVMLLMAIQRYLQMYHMSLADVFPIVGTDIGTLIDRSPPTGSIVKTGTLSVVSALSGAIFTRDRGLVWFSIINSGWDIEGFRIQQDELLGQLAQYWGGVASPPDIMRSSDRWESAFLTLGSLSRNEILR
ncbi:D-alanyl-D-alanine carboxypeptidase [Roseofilum casamattae]|uniref:D-alanyl-D-alanine carboxypeptidase n=1 Tax=Roseofilum casamattae BLCC-M143 TaxID=3022442 RepID=A0ABT7C0N9_9CYAN|nr:D-alanyl-D-alanine carboxypeptidase [Roseofilum casamattae]MDJ1184309.1 D-alanyl-D-alanine carboxypeptidase [Roseofilum casamattae BLCC-M143]